MVDLHPHAGELKRTTSLAERARFGLLHVPICVAPMAGYTAYTLANPGPAGTLVPAAMVAISCLLTLRYTWKLYLRDLEEERRLSDLSERVRVDPLTGLRNRRALWRDAASEAARARRTTGPISACLIDLDNFKVVNDRFGHRGGDAVLKAFAELARDLTRDAHDLLYRVGGDEFVILLPGTAPEDAAVISRRLRKAFVAAVSELAPGCATGCSVGIAALSPGEEVDTWLHRADTAMYRAKESGGGVKVARDSMVPMEEFTLPLPEPVPTA